MTQPNDFALHEFICDDMMLYPMKEMRPSWDQLLINKKLWSLEFSDIENKMMCQELKEISINKFSIEENFANISLKQKFKVSIKFFLKIFC
jgi:hypothetical protein